MTKKVTSPIARILGVRSFDTKERKSVFGDAVKEFRYKERGRAFASSLYSQTYGSYHHEYLAVSVRGSLSDACLSSLGGEISLDDQASLDQAMQNLAYQHEIRHFHDCFGTLAGISLFFWHVHELREFYTLTGWLRRQNLSWRMPLRTWVRENDCPTKIKRFYHLFRSRRFHRDLFVGSLAGFNEEGPSDEPWEWIVTHPPFPLHEEAPPIPAFPMSAGRRSQASEDRWTHFCPLALVPLLEGNAQAVQRSLLEAICRSEVVNLYWQRMTQYRVEPTTSNSESSARSNFCPLPYNVTDYLLTRFLTKERGCSNYPRSLILKVTDAALMTSLAPSTIYYRDPKFSRHPGAAFVDVLNSTDWRRDLEDCSPAVPISSDDLYRIISNYRAKIRPMSDPSRSHPIDVIESYAVHHVIIPLLELRLRYGHSVFSEPLTYWKHIVEFPVPAMIFGDRGIQPSTDMPRGLMEAWLSYVLLQNLMTSIMDAEHAILPCPRAYNLIPGIERCELAYPESCSRHISDRSCMNWTSGSLNELPKCRFSKMLAEMGFD